MNTAIQLFLKQKKQSKVVSPSPETPETKETSEIKHSNRSSSTDRSYCDSLGSLLGIELPFDSLYELQRKLRSGSFATVWVTKHRLSGDIFATKVIDRRYCVQLLMFILSV